MAGKRNQSVADFPQEFFQIWALAAKGCLKLTLPSRGSATNLKQRLYTFRKRLAQEAPELAQEFLSVDLRAFENEAKQGVLEAYVPEWKKQVAETATKKVPLLSPEEPIMPQIMMPQELELGTGVSHSLAETLKDLGFGTENEEEKDKG